MKARAYLTLLDETEFDVIVNLPSGVLDDLPEDASDDDVAEFVRAEASHVLKTRFEWPDVSVNAAELIR